jgi:hypothetical protein
MHSKRNDPLLTFLGSLALLGSAAACFAVYAGVSLASLL